MDVNPMRLSTTLHKLANMIENLEYKLSGDEVHLAEYCKTGRQLPAPEMVR